MWLLSSNLNGVNRQHRETVKDKEEMSSLIMLGLQTLPSPAASGM